MNRESRNKFRGFRGYITTIYCINFCVKLKLQIKLHIPLNGMVHFPKPKYMLFYIFLMEEESWGGHFVLEKAVWLDESNGETREIDLPNVEKILIDAADITMVEFMKPLEAKNEP